MVKVPKYLDAAKFMVSMRLLLENMLFKGFLLGQIPNLKMEDCDLGDHEKFP